MNKHSRFRLAVLATLAFLAPSVAGADLDVDSKTVKLENLSDTHATIRGNGVLILTASEPIKNSTVDLEGHNASLILEGVLPSEAKAYLPNITIAGKPFDSSVDRLSIYGNGSEIIPDGWASPLTIYKEENFGGESMVCDADIYYRGRKVANSKNYLPQTLIDDFDNNIRSFRLKRGFSCTFANNYDGTGFSRVFTATDADLEVPTMPEGLEFASFIRVCRADRIGKRGICGLDITPVTRSTWYYSWGASDDSQENFEFIPMRHNKWWDGWDKIGSRTNSSQVLGYNEPDHTDQSDLSPDYAISEWPNFMKSGLRAGSPAPDAIRKDWLTRFLATADSLNYRVDFVATHMYWNSQQPQNLTKQINDLCKNTYGGRPMWITEWNNGANWTHEWWPDQKGTRLDADFNVLLDENGKNVTVDRPHTRANSEVQVKWLGEMLAAFDECLYLERHSFYNWVEDARSVVIEGKLTPAGRVFADFRSRPAFDHEREYVHKWRIAPPFPKKDDYATYSRLSFADHNGETGKCYIVERRINGGEWEVLKVLENGIDYTNPTANVTFKMPFDILGRHEYRVKAVSYKGDESLYSRIIRVDVEKVGVDDIDAPGFRAFGRDGQLIIESTAPATYHVYCPDGRLAASVHVDGTACLDTLPRGIYIINNTKVRL